MRKAFSIFLLLISFNSYALSQQDWFMFGCMSSYVNMLSSEKIKLTDKVKNQIFQICVSDLNNFLSKNKDLLPKQASKKNDYSRI